MILDTKLILPQPKAGSLLRTELIDLIKNNLDKKLVLITADGGYGKTTLLAQLVKHSPLPAVFYDLDSSDSDLFAFYSYLIAGLEKLSPGLSARSAVLLKQAGQTGSNHELLMGTLINELFEKRKQELFFVLDDYQHLAGDSPVHQALDYFIDHMPESVHVIIASRAAVQFANYAKWYAKQNAFEVHRSDLRFSECEINELLVKTYGQSLCETDLKALLEHTEGWITGIQMILSQVRSPAQSKTIRQALNCYLEADQPLLQFFAKEILLQEPENLQNFLRRSSVLEIVTSGACDAVCGENDSAAILKKLERRNLFISKIGPGHYKYHRLFRDFLRNQIESREERRGLCLKAARYYQLSQMPKEAIEYFLEAGQYQDAAEAIILSAAHIKMDSYYTTLNNWIARLPGEIVAGYPRLMIEKGVICQEQGDLHQAEGLFLRAEALLKSNDGKISRGAKHGTAMADALLSRGKLLWLQGRHEEAFPVLLRAIKACPATAFEIKATAFNSMGLTKYAQGNYRHSLSCFLRAKQSATRSGNGIIVIMVESNLAMFYLFQGKVRLALDGIKSAYQAVKGRYYREVGVFYANAASAALVAGEVDWAWNFLNEGWKLCCPYEDTRSKAALNGGFGYLYMHLGQWDLARRHLETALEESSRIGWKDLEGKVLQKLAGLCRIRGDWEKAGEYLELAKPKFHPLSLGWVGLQLESAQLEASQGRHANAAEIIKKCLQLSRRNGWRVEEFQAHLITAAIRLGKGDVKRAGGILSALAGSSRRNAYDGLMILALKHNPALADLLGRLRTKTQYIHMLIDKSANEGEAADNAGLKIRLFGALQVCLADGREIQMNFPTRKDASLFAFLVFHRSRMCHRDDLMNNIWPREKAGQAVNSLYSAVYVIKKCLSKGLRAAGRHGEAGEPVMIHNDQSYRIFPALPCLVDVEEFRDQFERAKDCRRQGKNEESRRGYQRCLELYRGDFLSQQDDLWCEEPRRIFTGMYLICLKEEAGYLFANKEYDEAAALYRKYLEREPYNEEVHLGYWHALKALGLKEEIKSDYCKFDKMMRRELKLELGSDIKEKYNILLSS